ELLEFAFMPGEFFAYTSKLAFQGLAKVLRLALSTVAQLVDGNSRKLLCAWRQCWQEFIDVATCRVEQLSLSRFTRHTSNIGSQGLLQEVERLCLGLTCKRLQATLPLRWFYPTRGNRHQFFVQSLRALTVQRQSSKQDYARNGIGDLSEACARQIAKD